MHSDNDSFDDIQNKVVINKFESPTWFADVPMGFEMKDTNLRVKHG